MLKKISSLAGAHTLSKKEQVEVHGGIGLTTCNSDADCVIPGAPFCISACINAYGNKLCVYDNLTCFGGGFGG